MRAAAVTTCGGTAVERGVDGGGVERDGVNSGGGVVCSRVEGGGGVGCSGADSGGAWSAAGRTAEGRQRVGTAAVGGAGAVRGAWTRNHCKRVELYGDRAEWE